MKQELTITVPTNWSAVTLRKYLQLQKDIKTYEDNDAALTATLFYHLCGVDAGTVKKLDLETFLKIKSDLESFIQTTDLPLKQFIKIGDVEYGFEPNLSHMSYGAYVDISKYENLGVDENWAEVMSILYRPITKKIGQSYEIKPYDGKLDSEKFLDVPMDVHFGALSFFFHLLGDLQKGILKYLKGVEGISPSILTILEKNGSLIPPSSNSVVTI